MGWLTTEELWWDDEGRLRTHAPSTYKIPLACDRPAIFNVKLADWSVNREPTIRRSKAVGEPPFMLAVSVLEALSMAVASVADYGTARGSRRRRRRSGCSSRSSGWGGGDAVRPEAVARFLAARPAALVRVETRARIDAARRRRLDAGRAAANDSAPSAAGSSNTWRSTPPGRCWRGGAMRRSLDMPLGPEIGQCCGGRTRLRVVAARAATRGSGCWPSAEGAAALPAVMIFGAGHVGRALAAALALLPVRPVLGGPAAPRSWAWRPPASRRC